MKGKDSALVPYGATNGRYEASEYFIDYLGRMNDERLFPDPLLHFDIAWEKCPDLRAILRHRFCGSNQCSKG